MRVLVTGNEGYLGTVATGVLAQRGHQVSGLDTGFYREGWLALGRHDLVPTVHKDTRDAEPSDLAGFDAVVHMADLSNDPLAHLDPEITFAINHRATVRLARLAREAGVGRFVYMSSCSVYGVAADEVVDESSPTAPQTPYAECKVRAEQELSALADARFCPVVLRNATAFGASPRLRFDVVLNNLAGWAHTTRQIRLESDGTPWRPLVHARDIAAAIASALEAPTAVVHDEVFNVGADGQNYQVKEVAEIVGSVFPGCDVQVGELGGDTRSYRVDFTKIAAGLPGFRCQWDAERGARELRVWFDRVGLTADDFRSRRFTRLAMLRHLRDTGQLDGRLRWTAPTSA